tara:strand:+ start:151 stop:348 length:198 start_codon:yes stop_codon:yes gene_type:complete
MESLESRPFEQSTPNQEIEGNTEGVSEGSHRETGQAVGVGENGHPEGHLGRQRQERGTGKRGEKQ